MSLNQQLQDIEIRRAIHLLKYNRSRSLRLKRLLLELEGDYETRIRTNLDSFNHGQGKDRSKRLLALLLFIRNRREKDFRVIERELKADAMGLAAEEAGFQVRAFETVLPGTKIKDPGEAKAREEASLWPILGASLAATVAHLYSQDVSRAEREIRLGVFEGETTNQIVPRVLGTTRGRREDGAFGTTRFHLDAITLTTLSAAASAVRELVWSANGVDRLRWTSVLDNRTSAICRARSGMIFPINSGPRPPAHNRCRSIMTPLLPGEVPQDPSYQTWLAQQTAAFQDDTLGKRKGRLFRQGGLTLDRFVDRNTGREFNLKDLRRREPDAFRRAGL